MDSVEDEHSSFSTFVPHVPYITTNISTCLTKQHKASCQASLQTPDSSPQGPAEPTKTRSASNSGIPDCTQSHPNRVILTRQIRRLHPRMHYTKPGHAPDAMWRWIWGAIGSARRGLSLAPISRSAETENHASFRPRGERCRRAGCRILRGLRWWCGYQRHDPCQNLRRGGQSGRSC
ncbi:hypothetical protein EJ03DRAFT_191928 [Teratosphaeria nubilosa]|uniref:Uncharacterized protein n=1 Tax=Teratosphaeria nubilosa TaxID=161662 RepID=A0A6G1L143_9PEZI|nr:hypothetical protein EJ03DRAFT_191928 [Teratosphaeria nubilosa]